MAMQVVVQHQISPPPFLPARGTLKVGNPHPAGGWAELTPPVGTPPLPPVKGTPPDARPAGGLGAGSDPPAVIAFPCSARLRRTSLGSAIR
ncbi:MAG: hypothetical protein ABI536_03460, partial [Gallionella sp.]